MYIDAYNMRFMLLTCRVFHKPDTARLSTVGDRPSTDVHRGKMVVEAPPEYAEWCVDDIV